VFIGSCTDYNRQRKPDVPSSHTIRPMQTILKPLCRLLFSLPAPHSYSYPQPLSLVNTLITNVRVSRTVALHVTNRRV